MRWKNWALASVFALTALSVGGAPTAAIAQQQQQTHLSQCGRDALIGAGVGAALGVLTSRHHQAQSAVLGAAVGGAGTWGVCRLLSRHDQQRVENDYQRSLSSNDAVTDRWSSDGKSRHVYVNKPTPIDNGCRQVTARIDDGRNGRQDMPPETFCRDGNGNWVPA